jgi:regulator of protease activity HflC (stomatin/prohibitin superfamily)
MQEVLSKDMVSCELDGCVFHRICDPVEAVITLENSKASMKLLAQSLLRSVVSTKTIAEILPGREIISKQTQSLFDQVTQNWGIKASLTVLKSLRNILD